MTLKTLQSRAQYWQARLNLREWSITVGWGTGKECPESGPVLGCCGWKAEELTAEIHITRRQKYQEETLIHELLHIVMQGHEAEVPEYDVHVERAINRIATALIRGE